MAPVSNDTIIHTILGIYMHGQLLVTYHDMPVWQEHQTTLVE